MKMYIVTTLLLSPNKFTKFQVPSLNSCSYLYNKKNMTNVQMNDPKTICPANVFEIWGKKVLLMCTHMSQCMT